MEAIALGVPLIGAALYFKYKPSRALLWYTLSAWAAANGHAAQERQMAMSSNMADVMARLEER
jgi:hypothetical protein